MHGPGIKRFIKHYEYLLIVSLVLSGCGNKPHGGITLSEFSPRLDPDYSDITIPPNIAPLNFIIKEKGTAYFVKFSSGSGTEIELASGSGKIQIPQRKWKKMLQNSAGKNIKIDIFSKDGDGKWTNLKPLLIKLLQNQLIHISITGYFIQVMKAGLN
jgi:hypothetical protein